MPVIASRNVDVEFSSSFDEDVGGFEPDDDPEASGFGLGSDFEYADDEGDAMLDMEKYLGRSAIRGSETYANMSQQESSSLFDVDVGDSLIRPIEEYGGHSDTNQSFAVGAGNDEVAIALPQLTRM